jgi:hypothetical protein
MEGRQPSYHDEIRRLYRLVESTSLKYLSVEHLHELGIEAKQIELTDDKLQFDPCFFQPQHQNFHKTYPMLDKTREKGLSWRPDWDRCLHGAAGVVAHHVRIGWLDAKNLDNLEENVFRIARRRYESKVYLFHLEKDVGDYAQETLLYMEGLLDAERENPGVPRQEFDTFYLSDLSPLTVGWRYVFGVI